jgi:hypothetical protein
LHRATHPKLDKGCPRFEESKKKAEGPETASEVHITCRRNDRFSFVAALRLLNAPKGADDGPSGRDRGRR